jgi:HlyD family secretion protein
MIRSTELPEREIGTSPLPLLDNGTGVTAPGDPRRSPRPLSRMAAALLLISAGGIVGLYFQGPGLRAFFELTGLEPGAGARAPIALAVPRSPSPERVAVMALDDVVAVGRLRPKEDIVTVATPFGAGDARIEKLLVAEGDVVAAGELLAVLDSMAKYVAALTNAQSNLETRRAVLAQTLVQVAAGKAKTQAKLQSARAAAEAEEESLRRQRKLLERGLTTQEAIDAAESAAAAARGDVARLTATLARFEDGPGGVPVDVAVAKADIAAAEAAVAQARRDLELARVRAPRAGTILDLAVREGEKAPPDGLLRLGNIERMEAAVEVFQSMVPRVRVGQGVAIVSEVLGETPLTGTVSHIGMLVGRQSVTADDPTANTDARVIEVIVQLDSPSSARAARYVGLEVVARIEVPTSNPVIVGLL